MRPVDRTRALMDAAADLHACRSTEEFRERTPAIVRRVVDADVVAYQEIDLSARTTVAVIDPPSAGLPPELLETLVNRLLTVMSEHPIYRRIADTGESRALAISDVWSRSRFRGSPLFRQVYRTMGVEDQLVVGLPSPRPVVTAIPLSRARWGFSADEHTDLDHLRPHLALSRSNAALLDRLRVHRDERDRLLGRAGIAMFGVRPSGRVEASDEVAAILRTAGLTASDRLAGAGEEWWRELRRGDPGAPRAALRIRNANGQLLLREVEPGTVVLRRIPMLDIDMLRGLGLTAREAGVLSLLVSGTTETARLASALGIQPATVRRHLENVFRKLGVHSRTEAVAAAIDAATL